MSSNVQRLTWLLSTLSLVFASLPWPAALSAGEVILKNQVRLQGVVTPLPKLAMGNQQPQAGKNNIVTQQIVMVSNDLQRFFVGQRLVLKVDTERNAGMRTQEVFNLTQNQKFTSGPALGSLGSILDIQPFDEFGRRQVTIKMGRGNTHVIQAITLMTPEYVKVSAKGMQWDSAIPITSLPPEIIDKILRKITEDSNPNHHLAIARFYLQAEMFKQAQQELSAIRNKFPELGARAEEVSVTLAQYEGRRLLNELKLRQAGGQHHLVRDGLKRFPTDKLDGPLLREIREQIEAYDKLQEGHDQAIAALSDLQAELVASKSPHFEQVNRCRAEIEEKLTWENMPRLEAFLRLGLVKGQAAEDRLALALSGWVMGSAHAESDLPLALRLWDARFLIQQYLRTDNPAERAARLADLEQLEGVTAARVGHILNSIPPFQDNLLIEPGKPAKVPLPMRGQKQESSYSILLPPEYQPDHAYPVIIALTDRGAPPERELTFWGGTDTLPGQAQRHGYIVIAPDYMPDNLPYDYSAERHKCVLDSLNDVRRRFHVDSDRIFLTGHGRGGDATFDLGLSHPDLFAGIIPISGVSNHRSIMHYWQNAKHLPIYVISGELDRETFAANSTPLNRMMEQGYDVMLSEYKGYGRDSFYAEIHKLFHWMSVHKRAKLPTDLANRTGRASDDRFYWLELNDVPPAIAGKGQGMLVTARTTPANAIIVTAGSGVTLWLNPELVKFEEKVEIRVNSKLRWSKPLKPDLKAMLEDFRNRGDRQNLYWAVLEF
jgi:pimeloyl-ACP methyl ester carboxylesterase